ncbi:hypothetical protein [Saccharopolyspora shandongensis]|uniref:hypothetical protein n=1 Tax=Saccharopolyspora shandongensis TaxID=418495 RepID=UPI0033CD5C90
MVDDNNFVIPEDLQTRFQSLGSAVDHIATFLTVTKGLDEDTQHAAGNDDDTSAEINKQRTNVFGGINELVKNLSGLVDMTSSKGQVAARKVQDAEQHNVDLVKSLGLEHVQTPDNSGG